MKFIKFITSHTRVWVVMIFFGFFLTLGSIVLFETSGLTPALVIGTGLVLIGGVMAIIVAVVMIGSFTKK